jgi:gluconolactonase
MHTRRDALASISAAAAFAAVAHKAFAASEPSERYPDPSVQVLDPSFNKYQLLLAAVERLATGMRWSEGPVYFGDARCVYWSDIPNNRIMRWDEVTGRASVYRQPSNNANGNTRDRQGRLVTCEHDTRRVTRTEYDGTITTLIDRFDGKPLNSPNDIVVKSDDSIWFTDPPFGILGNYEGHVATPELPTNVYRFDPKSGHATVVTGDVNRPNGLAFSPDEKKLYIVEAGVTPRVIKSTTSATTSFPMAAPLSLPNRAARLTASAATSTEICGAVGVWEMPSRTGSRFSIPPESRSASLHCPSAAQISASVVPDATVYSWQRAIRSIRST